MKDTKNNRTSKLEPSVSGHYRCGHCLEETGNVDAAAFAKQGLSKDLLRHRHGAEWAWPIEWPKGSCVDAG